MFTMLHFDERKHQDKRVAVHTIPPGKSVPVADVLDYSIPTTECSFRLFAKMIHILHKAFLKV